MTGSHDACYSGSLYLPEATGEHRHTIELMVSFLVPYFVVYSSRLVDDLEEIEREKTLRATPPRAFIFFVHDTMYVLPAWVGKLIRLFKPELADPPSMEEDKPTRQVICFTIPTTYTYASSMREADLI